MKELLSYLKMVKEKCKSLEECDTCPFVMPDRSCVFLFKTLQAGCTPENWRLEELDD